MRPKAGSRACRSAPTIMSQSRSSRANWSCVSAIFSSAPRRRRWRRWSRPRSGPTSIISIAANCARATRTFISPIANARCCAFSPSRAAKPCRAARSPATAPSTSGRWTCRSTGSGARSNAIPPIPCSCRQCAASAIAWSHRLEQLPMSTLDTGLTLIRTAAGRVAAANDWIGNAFKGWMPSGLYARALLIMIVPMVILQSVVAFVFMERHWNTVTRHLSAAVVQDIASLIDVYKNYPQDKDRAQLRRIAQRMQLVVDFLPVGDMPPPGPKPFFSLLDQTLSVQLGRQIGKPFWIDTVGRSNLVEIRIQLDDSVMRIFAQRSSAYASNSEIFLFWMLGTSSILLIVAVLFLRNQIKPILRLADAAESFGKGREAPNFRPRGAREVRRAAQAFLEMKSRIERSIEQRTAMLAGVSHDLRTILTRFKLELALIGDSPEVDGMRKDVDEMSGMLEAYLSFARGDSGEIAQPTDMTMALEELRGDAERNGHAATVAFHGLPVVTVKPAAFKRCLANLVSNAARHANAISITGHRDHRYLTVTVDDDGPGIPANMREEVFKPFLRLDDARNQDEGGTGLGLAIARDIARSHGGDIMLGDSPIGGLRATVRIPV